MNLLLDVEKYFALLELLHVYSFALFFETIRVELRVSLWYLGNSIDDSYELQDCDQLYEKNRNQHQSEEKILPSKCEFIIIKDVPKRLNVIANDAFVRTGPTTRCLIISSSGSKRGSEMKNLIGCIHGSLPVQNHIKSRRINIHRDNVPK